MEENKVAQKDSRFPSPPYYVSVDCKLIPKAVDEELTRLDTECSRLASRVEELENLLRGMIVTANRAGMLLSDAIFRKVPSDSLADVAEDLGLQVDVAELLLAGAHAEEKE